MRTLTILLVKVLHKNFMYSLDEKIAKEFILFYDKFPFLSQVRDTVLSCVPIRTPAI